MDKFSNLPKDITDSILTLIPLKDAVRTSILSKEWRYKWTSIPSLVFTKECCPASCKDKPEIRAKLTSIINHVLSLHTGSVIQVFKVTERCPCPQVNSWLSRVFQSFIKELAIHTKGDLDDHAWSSSLYICTTLTRLDLQYCRLKPPPTFFNGLKNLKTLCLEFVYLSEDVFEALVRGCPMLENLRVTPINNIPNLRINAPSLRCLNVSGGIHGIMFGDTHVQLSVVTIWFYHCIDAGTQSYMAELFSKIPNVETLAIEGLFFSYLTGGLIPKRLPNPCYDLRSLTLELDFGNEVLILGALCILRSTPNLSTLTITDVCWTKSQLENMNWSCCSCTLNKLTTLAVHQQAKPEMELHFIKFLLVNSTVLQKMTIHILEEDFALPNKPDYQPYTPAQIDFVVY